MKDMYLGQGKKKKRLSIVQILKNWNLENHLVSQKMK